MSTRWNKQSLTKSHSYYSNNNKHNNTDNNNNNNDDKRDNNNNINHNNNDKNGHDDNSAVVNIQVSLHNVAIFLCYYLNPSGITKNVIYLQGNLLKDISIGSLGQRKKMTSL